MKTILFSILLLFSINGVAFNWKKVAEGFNNGHSFYVDIDNIKKRNGLVYYWELNDLLEPITGPLGNVNSGIKKYKANCVEEKLTLLNQTYYSQPMSKERILYEDSPNIIQYPKPKSVGYTVMKFVCDYAK